MSKTSLNKIFVTGGRGRLASLIAEHLGGTNDLRLYSRTNSEVFHPLEELSGDLVSSGADSTLLHLAWSGLPATTETRFKDQISEDTRLLETTLRACQKNRAHFIFFSSGGAVYGNAQSHPSREIDPCTPIGAYGQAKLDAENLIRASSASYSFPHTILRISNPYGYTVPRERMQGIIPHAVRCALEGSQLTLWGDGQAKKDFIYYTDFLSALDQVIAQKLTGTFNLSSGESHTVQEILDVVEKHTARKIAVHSISAPAWDVQDSRLDNSRLVNQSGWNPKIRLDEGISRFVSTLVSK